jgi:hypothetical protein
MIDRDFPRGKNSEIPCYDCGGPGCRIIWDRIEQVRDQNNDLGKPLPAGRCVTMAVRIIPGYFRGTRLSLSV